MDSLFISVLNMSLIGAFVIAAISLVRLPLKKAPKIISYCLWAVAGFRLVFPFSIESIISLIPFNASPIPQNIAMQTIPQINSGIPVLNNAVNTVLPAAAPAASVNPLQIWIPVAAYVWIAGAVAMTVYGIVSYLRLKKKMKIADHVEDNIYEHYSIRSPFVLGVFKPNIYIPTGLSGQDREYIITHEQTHISRRDHIIKFAAYFILCLHWFNPLVWIAFVLMGVDMEMSCDERVLRELGVNTKKEYSLSLLSLAENRRLIGGSPLAFSEGGLKTRIKNVLNFKKPSRMIAITAMVLAIALSLGFALNRIDTPVENHEDPPPEGYIFGSREPITAEEYARLLQDIQLEEEKVDLGCCVIEISVFNTPIIGANSVVHTGNDFIMTLNSDKRTYTSTDIIKIWGTLEYTGNNDSVEIWHGCPFMLYTLAGGDKFGSGMGGGVAEILTSSVLEKGKVYHFNYQKGAGWSADDPDADFWENFVSEEDLVLSAGEYTVRLNGGFGLSENVVTSASGLAAELEFVVTQ